jgi:mRNA interferase MazF
MSYIPERGDIIWLNFTPQKGREQSGTRPALVLSPSSYNKKTGLAICCPITSQVKGYPFEVSINGKKINGVILADHVKNLDWKERRAKLIEHADTTAVEETLGKLSALLWNQ